MTAPMPSEPNIIQQMRTALRQAREAGATPEQMDWLVKAWGRAVENVNEAEQARTPQSFEEAMAAPLVSALDAGTFGLAGLATDALSPGDFRTNRDARRAAYEQMSPSDRVLSSLAGGLANPVSRVIPGAQAGGANALRVAGRGALEGAAQGALTGLGENIGTTEGAVVPTALGAVGGAVAGGTIAPIVSRLARGRGSPAQDALRRALQAQETDAGPVVPATQPPMATGQLFRPVAQRTPLASVAPDRPTPMAVDVAGPTMRASARGATGTVPGREALRGPFAAREAQMPQAMESAFNRVTGTTAQDAERLAVELADAERGLAQATAGQKAQYEAMVQGLRQQHAQAVAAARAVQPPPKPKPRSISDALAALEREAPIPDAPQQLAAMQEARRQVAAQMYPEAIEATKGQIPDILPETDAFLRSPTGEAVWKAVQRERGDVTALDPSRAFPTVTKWAGNEAVDTNVPDAEAFHRMKQYLQNAAKLGENQTTPEGITALQANNALRLLEPVMAQQDELFRAADLRYAEQSAPMSALRLGMTPLKGNPPVKQTLSRSLSAVEKRAGEMTPAERSALAQGKQFDIASRFRAGMSPARAADLLAEPTSDLARQVELAYGPGAAQRLAASLRTPEATPFQRPVVPPFVAPPKPTAPQMPQTLAAALRGVDVPRTPMVPSAASPERSLPTLQRDVRLMSDEARQQVQRGAAAGFRREMASGKPLRLDVPERMEQFRFASPEQAPEMADVEATWNRTMQTQRDILPSGQLAIEPAINTPMAALSEAAAPTPQWAVVKGVRNWLGKSSAGNLAERGAEDAAFGGLMTGRPETLADALANLAFKDAEVRRTTARTTGAAGRTVGGMMR